MKSKSILEQQLDDLQQQELALGLDKVLSAAFVSAAEVYATAHAQPLANTAANTVARSAPTAPRSAPTSPSASPAARFAAHAMRNSTGLSR